MRVSFIFAIFILSLTFFAGLVCGQSGNVKPTPTPAEDVEKIYTEEIRINITALDRDGKFAAGLKKEDLVISEDGRLHQADSLRSVPANVLLLLDTGGEERRIKGLEATRRVAKSLVNSLKPDDQIAVIEYNDQAKVLSDWSGDKIAINAVLDRKLGYGRSSLIPDAFAMAVKFMEHAPQENRHIVLITDGIDSTSSSEERAEAIRNLLTTSINVHVLSYTLMERNDLPIKGGVFQKGGGTSTAIPPEILITMPGPVQDTAKMPRIGSINLDKAMMRKYKQRAEALKKSEAELTKLSEDTNGEIFLPTTTEEMQDKTSVLAKTLDSQYTLTYTPKRPLNNVEADEERTIEVSSRRPGLTVQGRRKLVVKKRQ